MNKGDLGAFIVSSGQKPEAGRHTHAHRLLALVRELLLQTQLAAVATGSLAAVCGTGWEGGVAPT